MLESAQALVDEHAELERQLADPAVHADPTAAAQLGQRYAELGPIVATYRAWAQRPRRPRGGPRARRRGPRLRRARPPPLEATLAAAEDRLRRLLVPRDPDDDRDVILEVKAGEGGEESALFAGDLLRMYLRYAERRGWKTEVLDADRDRPRRLQGRRGRGEGARHRRARRGAWARLKYEGGVHRVQRVPVTESPGPHPHQRRRRAR